MLAPRVRHQVKAFRAPPPTTADRESYQEGEHDALHGLAPRRPGCIHYMSGWVSMRAERNDQ